MIRETSHGGSLEVRVYVGRDALTGKSKNISRTVRGTGREAMRAAKQLEAQLMAEVKAGRHQTREKQHAGVTVDELLDQWLEVARHEASTSARMKPLLAKHIRPRIGSALVRVLTTRDIDRLYVQLEREANLAPASVLRLHGNLRAALNQAITWGWIDKNPATKARVPDVARPDPDPPAPEAVIAFMAAAWADDPDLACFIRVGAATGMRRGEVCALRRSSLLLDAGALRKTHAIGDANGTLYVKQPKNTRRHVLAIDHGTVLALRDQVARVDDRALKLDTHLAKDPYIFTKSVDGSTPWAPNAVTKAFAALRESEHVKKISGTSKITPRSLRHFVTTELLEHGASITTVTNRGGWSRSSTPLEIYAGFLPAGDTEAAAIMGGILDGDGANAPA